jgi:hypothetical protein
VLFNGSLKARAMITDCTPRYGYAVPYVGV